MKERRRPSRRNSTTVKLLPEDINEEEAKKLKLSENLESNRKLKRSELKLTLLAVSITLVWNLGSYITFRTREAFNDEHNSNYLSAYTYITVIVSLTTIYHMRHQLKEYIDIGKQLNQGIKVKRNFARVHAMTSLPDNKTTVTSGIEVDDDDEEESRDSIIEQEDLKIESTTLEYRIIEWKREMRNCKMMIKLAVFVDALLLSLNFYRLFFMNIWVEDKVAECLGDNGHLFICGTESHFFAVMSAISSLGSFMYRMSYYRDYKRYEQHVNEAETELTREAAKTSSPLDKFSDVTEDEVNKVVIIRNIMKNVIDKFPREVFGDYALLGWLRASKHDTLQACEKIRQCVAARIKYKVDLAREEILLNDWSVTMIPAYKRIKECWPGFLHNMLGFESDTNTMYYIYVWYYEKVNKGMVDSRYKETQDWLEDYAYFMDYENIVLCAIGIK